MNKVYAVEYADYDWDVHQIAKIFSSEERANQYREVLFSELLEIVKNPKALSVVVTDYDVE